MDPLPTLNNVFSLVIQEESNNPSVSAMVTLEDSSVSINAYDARKSQGRGKGVYNKPTRHCTFCNKTNHTVEFCYQMHGFPNVNKPTSQANATSGEVSVVNVSSGVSGLSQGKMEQLLALLQQENLIPSPSISSGPVTNHIAAPHVSSSYTTPSSLSPTSAGIVNSTTCSSLSDSYWLIVSGANEHICLKFLLLITPLNLLMSLCLMVLLLLSLMLATLFLVLNFILTMSFILLLLN